MLVFHLDSGKKEMVPLQQLVELPQSLCNIRRLARPAKLYGIQPMETNWRHKATDYIKTLENVSTS